jgi:hypothetical protein
MDIIGLIYKKRNDISNMVVASLFKWMVGSLVIKEMLLLFNLFSQGTPREQ